MTCRDICSRFRATRSHAPNSQYYSEQGRYEIGQKRCQECQIFIKWSSSRCPCCHTSLRTRPRPKKYREKLFINRNTLINANNNNASGANTITTTTSAVT